MPIVEDPEVLYHPAENGVVMSVDGEPHDRVLGPKEVAAKLNQMTDQLRVMHDAFNLRSYASEPVPSGRAPKRFQRAWSFRRMPQFARETSRTGWVNANAVVVRGTAYPPGTLMIHQLEWHYVDQVFTLTVEEAVGGEIEQQRAVKLPSDDEGWVEV